MLLLINLLAIVKRKEKDMNNYFKEVKDLIIEYESNKKVREIQNNREDLLTRWNIGRLIVEAQGGDKRAKYGDNLIKEWGDKLSKMYNVNYNSTNLKRYREFFMIFEKGATLSHISWSHIFTL